MVRTGVAGRPWRAATASSRCEGAMTSSSIGGALWAGAFFGDEHRSG